MKDYEAVWDVVKTISEGKVATYGQIAKAVNSQSLRKITPHIVAFALHANKDPDNVPCHRVVNKKGELALGYAFGGVSAQKEKLLIEGVSFVNEIRVDLSKNQQNCF